MYDEKDNLYFKNVRKDLLKLIPEENKNGNMLEIGAGGGNTLIYAKENNYAENIYGVELFKMDNSNQTSEKFENFIIGNIEEIELPFSKAQFDVIILGDVLEHLIDPYSIVEKLSFYLKDNGSIIASLPNIREWKTMKSIFYHGDFKYEEEGILDKTHLRFFTKKNIAELFNNNGFNVQNIVGSNQEELNNIVFFLKRYLKSFRFGKLYNHLMLGRNLNLLLISLLSNEFIHIQYFVVAKKK